MISRRQILVFSLCLVLAGCAPPLERAHKACDQWLENLKNDQSYLSAPLVVKDFSEMGGLFQIAAPLFMQAVSSVGKAGTDLKGHTGELMERRFVVAPELYKDLFGRLVSYQFSGERQTPGNLLMPAMYEQTYDAQFENMNVRLVFMSVESGGKIKIVNVSAKLPSQDLQTKMDNIFYGPFIKDMGGYLKEHKDEFVQTTQGPGATVTVNGRVLNDEEKKEFAQGTGQLIDGLATRMQQYNPDAAQAATPAPHYSPVTIDAPAVAPAADSLSETTRHYIEARVKYIQTARRFLNRDDLKPYCTKKMQDAIDASVKDFDATDQNTVATAQQLFSADYTITGLQPAAGGVLVSLKSGPSASCVLNFVHDADAWLLDSGFCLDGTMSRSYAGNGQVKKDQGTGSK